ncbi:MAG TPA: hypothetical protein VFS35_01315 [Terrimicrobiaceae bacterium]|nr:hypothetical protein [Terrimicrobiaceae bacterium]
MFFDHGPQQGSGWNGFAGRKGAGADRSRQKPSHSCTREERFRCFHFVSLAFAFFGPTFENKGAFRACCTLYRYPSQTIRFSAAEEQFGRAGFRRVFQRRGVIFNPT